MTRHSRNPRRHTRRAALITAVSILVSPILVAAILVAAIIGSVAAPAVAAPATAPIRHAGSPAAIPGSYLVALTADATFDAPAAGRLAARYGGVVSTVYNSAMRGFSARLSETAARRLAADPAVAYVEQVQAVHALGTQLNPDWGLDRVDQHYLPLDHSYTYGPSKGASAYVIDTGIRITHTDFGGRASYGYDAIDGDAIANDGNGHGTFVAGIIGGTGYGVAKDVKLVAVRVLNDAGSGTTAGVIAGIDWVTSHAVHPAVANMSLGGAASTALDSAVRASIASGITYTVAAGGSNADAGNYSPARVAEACTVGATDATDTRASGSNYGSVLDLFAPGVNITSDWNTSDTAIATLSGTSFAAAFVAGAVALLYYVYPTASPAAACGVIVATATTGVITNPGTGSPNRLLYTRGF